MQTWKIDISPAAMKELRKLSHEGQRRIFKFLNKLAKHYDHPRDIGKAMRGGRDKLWRYRVGDYRVICRILEDEVVVMVLDLGHRREIYGRLPH